MERHKLCYKYQNRIRVTNTNQLQKNQHVAVTDKRWTFSLFQNQIWLCQNHFVIRNVEKIHSPEKISLSIEHFDETLTYRKEEKDFDLEYDELYIFSLDSIPEDEHIESNYAKINPSYNLFTNNNEHAANQVTTGKAFSSQIDESKHRCFQLFKRLKFIFSKLLKVKEWVTHIFSNRFPQLFDLLHKAMHYGVFSGIESLIFTIYCVGATILFRYEHKKEVICSSCCRKSITKVWLQFLLRIPQICLTLANLVGGGPLINLVATYVFKALIFIINLAIPLFPQVVIDKKFYWKKITIRHASEVNIGDVLSVTYFGLDHKSVVTEILQQTYSKNIVVVNGIHYGFSWTRRTIQEDEFRIDCDKAVCKCELPSFFQRFSPNEIVRRARLRIGERKFNALSNRSSHFCHWVILQMPDTDLNRKNDDKCVSLFKDLHNHTEDEKGMVKSTALIGKYQVHFCSELTCGDVVEAEWCIQGVVMNIEKTSEREFSLCIMTCGFRQFKTCEIKRVLVNLNTDELLVRRYLPIHTRSKKRILELAEKYHSNRERFFSKQNFINKCVLKDCH